MTDKTNQHEEQLEILRGVASSAVHGTITGPNSSPSISSPKLSMKIKRKRSTLSLNVFAP